MIITAPRLNKTDAEKQFTAWFATKNCTNGNKFKSFVANGDARNLRSESPTLDISPSLGERDVFRCITTAEFDAFSSVFQAAPNYREVNRGMNHGAFSAGVSCIQTLLAVY